MNIRHLLAKLDTLQINEEVSPDDIEGLLQQLKSGEISYEEFRSQLDGFEHTDASMRQGEMGNPDARDDMAYNKPGGERDEWDQFDREEEDEYEEESVSPVAESVEVAECGDDMPAAQSDKPTMNVTMNASNADSIRELLNVLSGFEGGDKGGSMLDSPYSPLSDEPSDLDVEDEGIAGAVAGGAIGAAVTKSPAGAMAGADLGSKAQDAIMGDSEVEEFINSPDEKYAPVAAVTASGDDLHRSKDSYSDKPYRGDNPMESLKTKLESLYNDLKSR